MNVPNGDLLLHAGDLTFRGDISEISQELKELGRISKGFKYGCVLVPGNHDFLAERDPSLMKQMCIDNGITYLQHERTEINGLKIFGSGYTPFFHNWALNVERGPKLAALWGQIPDDTEILITHGPAMGCLDWVVTPNGYESVGCQDLANRLPELKSLKLHVFGHLHLSRGTYKNKPYTSINASICKEDYSPTNLPIIFALK